MWFELSDPRSHLQISATGVKVQLNLVATKRNGTEIGRVVLVTGYSRVATTITCRSRDSLGISGTGRRRITEALRDWLAKLLQCLDLQGGSVFQECRSVNLLDRKCRAFLNGRCNDCTQQGECRRERDDGRHDGDIDVQVANEERESKRQWTAKLRERCL